MTPPLGALEPASSQDVGVPSAVVSGSRAQAPVRGVPALDSSAVEGTEGEPQAREQSSLRGSARAAPSPGTPPGVPSLVHTKDITRPSGPGSAHGQEEASTSEARADQDGPAIGSLGQPREIPEIRLAWLERVGVEISDYCNGKARTLFARAIERTRAALRAGYSEQYAREEGAWHRQRAKGQQERVERVMACGAKVIEITCQGCGRTHERRVGCRIGLLCPWCRGSIAAECRARFLGGRAAWFEDARPRGLLLANRRGGAYTEKFVTLTAPHIAGDTVGSRIERVLAAWPAFLKALNRYLKGIGAASAQFYRCIEWVSAKDDDAGHPHVHFWFVGPFLHWEQQVQFWWRNALLYAGMPASAPGPFVHIQRVTDGAGGSRELIKYLTKDIDHTGRLVPPVVFARVYESFDGRRLRQASSGFLAKAKGRQQCECGSDLPHSVRLRRE